VTNKPATFPAFDRYGVADLAANHDLYGDIQSLQLHKQKDGRMFCLWVENGCDEAGYRDLTPAMLRQIGEALIAISEDHK
jgi:hypothetical protein